MQNKIFWFAGLKGSGKTTLATEFQRRQNPKKISIEPGMTLTKCILLHENTIIFSDGKDSIVSDQIGLAKYAKLLSEQVSVLVISEANEPDRTEIKAICDPVWIHVKRTFGQLEGYEEKPEYAEFGQDYNPIIINHDELNPRQAVEALEQELKKRKLI